jgi:hypothetical protein
MPPDQARRLIDAITSIERREQALDETLWAPDVLAQRCGSIVDDLWDALNGATNRWAVLERLTVPNLSLPEFGPPRTLPHGIQVWEPTGTNHAASAVEWPKFLTAARHAGWLIVQTEFRHNRFQPDARGRPNSSVFHFSAHLTNAQTATRAALTGDLTLGWAPSNDSDDLPAIASVDATRLVWSTRAGPPPFDLAFDETIPPFDRTHFIDPLILHDLDGDGRSEIVLAARNLVYRWHGWNDIKGEPLCRHSPGLIFTAVIADFDGDGIDDFLCARFEGLVLLRGATGGRFDQPGEQVWSAQPHLRYGQVLTCGDIDGDGDLDVWLGQYKGPYDRGQMPTPYYDANDGNPSYLLLNDGTGRFTDITAAAGLDAKRRRRSYSGSFVDLDQDGLLDLVVVSDFAGVDVYHNRGHGRFTDRTADWLPESHAFGMAHTLADFDGDARLDLLVMGMTCSTPQRLDSLGLNRPERPEVAPMRSRMAAGNRLCLGQPNGGFRLGPAGPSIAQSGWSWGCSAADLDNDGFPDVAIANGHESKQTVRDYEPEFWRHDIYVGGSTDDAVLNGYFAAKLARTRGQGQSYGGFEKNRLFLNLGGREFVEAGHLLGVALEADSRCCVTDDLDGDGRLDLLITTFEAWPEPRQALRVYRNSLDSPNHWIGFRLASTPHSPSPIGAQITLEAGEHRQVRTVVTGDSHRAQHAWTVHFGLGKNDHADRATIRWPSGSSTVLERPRTERYWQVQGGSTDKTDY